MSVPAPMLATAGRPPDTPGRWAIEMKWDGMRAVCRLAGERVELFSRNRNNVSACYPELAAALTQRAHGTDMIVDGEIVAPDPGTGAPSFARLQQRMHLTRPAREPVAAVPVQLFVFDLLEREGVGTMGLPYVERRARLSELDITGNGVRVPPYWTFTHPPDSCRNSWLIIARLVMRWTVGLELRIVVGAWVDVGVLRLSASVGQCRSSG
ncbi:ATP-dependent DNA ligase [Nocardia sp. NPDC004573]